MDDIVADYDVVIVGGGPAGASAAIHLATAGARVLLAEQKKFPRPKLCGEFISPECFAHFVRLGVMERMEGAGGAKLTETVFYSPGGNCVTVPSEWFGSGSQALGLSRAEMDRRLLWRAREAGACVLEETRAAGLLIQNGCVGGVRLETHGEIRTYRSLITIDATGRARALARRIEKKGPAGCRPRLKKRAPLVAFKTHLVAARGAPSSCEIYFYRGGYGGLSPVEGGLSNLCFIASAQDVRARGGDAARVMRELVASNKRAAHTLSEARPVSGWLSVALESFGRRELVPADGLIAVGDAASFIDPFTGSGMLMALESGALAAETIANWLRASRARSTPFTALAHDYRARYDEKFNARLRLCSLLRRAAFAPQTVVEALVRTFGASASLRRCVARATRRRSIADLPAQG